MEIKVAEYCGFCYGVKRAVELAQKAAAERAKGGTYGPLIHNPQLINELAQQGIACRDSLDEFRPGETVIIRSHGVGPEVYVEAEQKGLKILDATCPNVKMAQQKAAQAAADGYFPIIVGEKNHPEVKSILKWAGKSAICIECIKDISCVPHKERYGVIIQTTFELSKFEDILQALQQERPGEYRVERTICLATSQRQKAAVKLAQESDAVIVIGGKNSANTRHLYELVSDYASKAYHVETASELTADMLRGCNKIGITAGASTPDRLIKEAIIAMENMDFESMLNESMEVEVYPGKVVNGTVIQLDKEGVYVAFGYRHDGLITYAEWNPAVAPEELMATIKVGDEVEAKVIPGSTKSDFVRLSKVKAERDAAWKNVPELAEGEKREATVKVLRIIKNKAKNIVGLAVAVEGVEGFMPASHVELRRVEDFTPYIGQELQAEIIEVDLEKKRIVVSRRDLLKAEREAKAKAWKEQKEAQAQARKEARAAAEEAAYASVAEGDVLPGKVVKVAEFGLFVEVGAGLVGLVHNTELSWDRNVKAADVAGEGDEVTVLVKKIDRENKRVALSIKATLEDPWKVEAGQFNVGDIVEAEVVRFLPFGAIVKLSDKVEGLVHISEIAQERIAKPDDALELGQVVKAEVIKMDLESKKIGLSISKVKRDAEKNEYRSYMGKKSSSLTQDLSEQLESLEK
ncbi:MAG: 4-hydroxy-3-methylbut-2-enyl diphosphate reductase [Phascolarctobacterium sp.]|nr:4-hydroxy-3-methylbut-2-enyl diphosphate reductase [Phascolarctobacterium sp.]